jgi:peptidoglycan/xylan/chitin deacetylase (PgdA/CDA1 family)
VGLRHLGLRAASLPWVVALVERVARAGATSQGHLEGAVGLTFDDGPHPAWTPPILDRLEQGGALATFFVVGRNVERHPDIVRETRRRGHEIGIHLYSHDRGTVCDPRAFDEELRRCQGQLESLLGESPRFLRFPYGNRGPQRPDAVLRRYGVRTVHWTYSSNDSHAASVEEVVGRVDAGLRSGAILLFHDALADEGPALRPPYRAERDVTLASLPPVLDRIRVRGLRAVTLTELLGARGGAS